MSELFYSIGQFLGIAAFVLLAALIFSGDTARFWNRYIGLDKIIKFQRKFSYFVAFFVLFHPIFFILAAKTPKGLLIPDFAYPPLAAGIISLYVFVGVMVASALAKRISYRVWQYIHVLTYVLFFMTLYHAINWGSDLDDYGIIYGMTGILIVIAMIYRTVYKLRAIKTSRFKVKSISMETADSFTVTLDHAKDFVAGQFCFLRINKNKLYARHPFTVSSAPGSDLAFTIKLAGRFTQTAKDLKPGDEVFVDGPFGKFIPAPEKDLVFVAGGVGITPFMSILRDHIAKGITQNITLIYGSRTEADIIFKKEIDAITAPWFKKIYLLSQVAEGSTLSESCERGYICKDVLERHVPNVKGSLYYICGPEVMKNGTKKLLKEEGVAGGQVFVEDFFW